MALHTYTIIVPYRMLDREDAPQFSLHVDAIASSPKVATNTAIVLTNAHCVMHHGSKPQQIYTERIRTSSAHHVIPGPYAYIFTRGDRIPQLSFPRRLDQTAAREFCDALAGLDQSRIHGLLVDCAQLSYISTDGIAGLMEQTRRLNIILCRIPSPIQKVLDIIGVTKHLHISSDMRGALETVIHRDKQRREKKGVLEERGFVKRE